MEVITIESGLWQQLLDRIERIETYVKEASAKKQETSMKCSDIKMPFWRKLKVCSTQ